MEMKAKSKNGGQVTTNVPSMKRVPVDPGRVYVRIKKVRTPEELLTKIEYLTKHIAELESKLQDNTLEGIVAQLNNIRTVIDRDKKDIRRHVDWAIKDHALNTLK